MLSEKANGGGRTDGRLPAMRRFSIREKHHSGHACREDVRLILYYALGGGLGHISRSIALIAHAPEILRRKTRLLVSSDSAALARPHAPCWMDIVPREVMERRGDYLHFLAGYLTENGFNRIVIDVFPFGLLGELKELAPEIPRILVGRYLKWDAYLERCGAMDRAVWPVVALMIEEQDDGWMKGMEDNSRIVSVRYPVSPVSPVGRGRGSVSLRPPACAVVHSGPEEETAILMQMAQQIMTEKGIPGRPELFTPARGVFPFPSEPLLTRFTDVVTGAGYGACATAAVLKGEVNYHFHPFHRRFDDQALRLRRMQNGDWSDTESHDGTRAVADRLWNEVMHQ